MTDVAWIAQAVDFVEDNLREPIGVADMAEAVSYSLYHFCRTFNQVTYHTPYDYLMRRRLAEAARVLLQTDDRIIDVALDHQFNNPETFSRAFKRVFGVQPSQWRRQGSIDRRRLMPRLTRAHLEHIARGAYLRPVLVEREAFQVAGVMTLARDDSAAESGLWDLLTGELERLDELVEPGDRYGITWYLENGAPGCLYMAAVEGQGLDVAHTALVTRTIPASRYARFVHKGLTGDLDLTLDYVYHTWLPRSGEHLALPLVVERRGPGFADDEASESEIYIPLG